MARFIVHKDKVVTKKQANASESNSYPFFWVPFAIVLAGALIGGAIIFKNGQVPSQKVATGDVASATTQENTTPTPTLPPSRDIEVDITDAPMLGEATASVTMIEFSDFQCPFCKKYTSETFDLIKEQFIDTGLVKYYFRDFPLTSIHPNAVRAAEAALCAVDQGSFWEYHDILFEKQLSWSNEETPDEKFVDYASEVGLDSSKFSSCLDTNKYQKAVNKSSRELQEKIISKNVVDIGGTEASKGFGTPSFLINGRLMIGAYPYESIKKVIEEALSGK